LLPTPLLPAAGTLIAPTTPTGTVTAVAVTLTTQGAGASQVLVLASNGGEVTQARSATVSETDGLEVFPLESVPVNVQTALDILRNSNQLDSPLAANRAADPASLDPRDVFAPEASLLPASADPAGPALGQRLLGDIRKAGADVAARKEGAADAFKEARDRQFSMSAQPSDLPLPPGPLRRLLLALDEVMRRLGWADDPVKPQAGAADGLQEVPHIEVLPLDEKPEEDILTPLLSSAFFASGLLLSTSHLLLPAKSEPRGEDFGRVKRRRDRVKVSRGRADGSGVSCDNGV
jgi:hypothetical protein